MQDDVITFISYFQSTFKHMDDANTGAMTRKMIAVACRLQQASMAAPLLGTRYIAMTWRENARLVLSCTARCRRIHITYITPTGLFCYIIRAKNEKIMEVHDNNTAAAERGEFGETAIAPSPQSNTCKRTARITRFHFPVYFAPFLNCVTNGCCHIANGNPV